MFPLKAFWSSFERTWSLGVTIHTHEWRGYADHPAVGYKHHLTVISGGDEPAHEVMPRVHNLASLLKRRLLSTLQGGVQH
jgi:hypothetical protein